MLTIWGRNNSVNVIKVLWAADELGLEYRRTDAGGPFGVVDTPEFLAMNPMGRVPVLVDGDLVVWESNAIVRYLAASHPGGGLWPASPAVRAPADMWMDWQQTALAGPITTLFMNRVRLPEPKRDAAAAGEAAVRCSELFAMLERHLASRSYVAGEQFTMGDIPVGAQAFRFMTLVAERPPMPALEAWYARLCERPAYRRHAMTPLA